MQPARVTRFDRVHLIESPLMTCFTAKLRVEERAYQLSCQFRTDDTATQDQDIHVVVLHALMRGICIMTKPGSNTGNLIGRHGSPHAAATNQNAALTAALDDGLGNHLSEIRIVII